MCGISCIISERNNIGDRIKDMVSVMAHRGPDASGVYQDKINDKVSIVLGHNRLSIIDLSEHAAQPMMSRDGRYVLVYNGEIYNYKEIAQDLTTDELPDKEFGDTAVVLAALIKWGPKAFPKFNGMWAVILYDKKERTLLVSRDRFGVKPLYYYFDGHSLYFSSEIKAILVAAKHKFTVNPHVAVPYLTRGLLNFSSETFFNRIQQFDSASYQFIRLDEIHNFKYISDRYWYHPYELGNVPVQGTVSLEEIRDLFIDAVRLRLRSDVPIGILLSGGVDSSAILGSISKLNLLSNLTILSVTSRDKYCNEEPFIDKMAQFVGSNPIKVNVSNEPLDLLSRLNDAVWFNDEPVCGISDIAYLCLMEEARKSGIKVLLSGQGADEQLGGYNKFFYFWIISLLKKCHYIGALKTIILSLFASNVISEFRLSEAMRYISKSYLSSSTFISDKYKNNDNVDIGIQGDYSKRELIDLVKTSVPALLHYEDRMSMSKSVEVRVPFLDYRLVEMFSNVHPSEKFEGGWTKSVFRKAISGLVPKEIQYRRDKKGFTVPENNWMKDQFKIMTIDMFSSQMMSVEFGLIDQEKLNQLYSNYLKGKGILNGRHFFRVCIFETFLKRFSEFLYR